MSLFAHASLEHLVLETALIVVVADSFVAVAALAVAACLKRNPAAAHCVLAFASAWIFVVPLAARPALRAASRSPRSPARQRFLVSALEPTSPPKKSGLKTHRNRCQQPILTRPFLDTYRRRIGPASRPKAAAPMRASARRHPAHQRPDADTASRPASRWCERRAALAARRRKRHGNRRCRRRGWLLGAMFLLTRTLRSYARMRAIRRTLTVLPEESFGPVLDDVRRRLNLVRLPQIASSDLVWTPCVLGLFRPVIALPADALRNVSTRQLGDVLVHEGAHVARRDCVVALAQKIAGSVFWPHPLIHWLNRRLTSVREEVCDNYVLPGTDAVSYGETLLHFAQVVGRGRPMPAAAVGMLHGSGRLEQRIAGLIDQRRNRHTRAGNFSRALALVAFGCLFLLTCGGRGHSEERIARKSELGRQGRTTNSIAQTPTPKRSLVAQATATFLRKNLDPGAADSPALEILNVRESLSKAETDSVQLVPGKPHTLRVPEAARIKLGIRRDNVDHLAIAKRVVRIPPLILPATTALDPNTIFRLRPYPRSLLVTTVVEIGKVAAPPRPGEKGPAEREDPSRRPGAQRRAVDRPLQQRNRQYRKRPARRAVATETRQGTAETTASRGQGTRTRSAHGLAADHPAQCAGRSRRGQSGDAHATRLGSPGKSNPSDSRPSREAQNQRRKARRRAGPGVGPDRIAFPDRRYGDREKCRPA